MYSPAWEQNYNQNSWYLQIQSLHSWCLGNIFPLKRDNQKHFLQNKFGNKRSLYPFEMITKSQYPVQNIESPL